MKANLTWAYRLLVLAFLLIVFLRCEFAQSEQRTSLFALGQRYFTSVGNEESIPGDVVTALAQDKSGFLWIGTQFGLLRFDGYSFKKYLHDPADPRSLVGNFINTIWLADDGRLWIGTTSNGMSVFDPTTEKFTNYHYKPGQKNSLSHNDIWAITGDGNGGVWIGTGNGLDYFEPSSREIKRYPYGGVATKPQSENRILSLLLDRQNNLWVGKQNGLDIKQASANDIMAFQTPTLKTPAFSGQEIRKLYQATDGAIWIGTREHGLSVYRPNSQQLTHLDLNITPTGTAANPEIRAITQVKDELWIGLYGSGILILDPQTGEVQERMIHDAATTGTISSNTVADFWVDDAGIVFVGTWGGRLNQFNPSNDAFRTLRHSPKLKGSLSFSNVRSALELADGNLWLGSWGKGIDVVSPTSGLLYTIAPNSENPNALGNSLVRTMVQSRNGTIWVGMDSGLYQYRPATTDFQRYSLQQGLPSNFVRTLLSDEESLWVGTRSGVTHWQKASNSFESLLLSNDQPMTEFVNALAKTPDGTLWVGTTNGLYALPSGETKLTSIFHLPDDPQSLSDNLISGLLVDANGQLWVDTRGGLNRLVSWHNKQVQFEAISAKAGKPGLYMGANLLSDKSDRLWTQWQVLDTKQWQFSKLTKADGVDIGTVWVGSYHKTRDGTLMYGGTTGLLMVHPERYAPWRYQPPIVISNLSIDGNSTPFVASKSISLPPEIRSFSIEFSALDFSAPQHNLYAYKLEGYDKDWNQTNAQHRVATYTNLDPGQYTLLIKGSNRAGQWSPHQLALMITQKPAWYETLWCRGLMWLLLATTLYFLYQRRVRYLQLKGARLQALVDEQTKELSIRNQKLDKANQELEQASLTDPLTGLKNRRFLNQVLTTDIATIKRLFNGPLAAGEAIDPVALERAKLHFFLIDIDHFKSVNDTYGHAAGDQLLKQIPLKLEKVFRSSDYFIRWGGEEFLVVARQTDGASALLFAERLRQEIAENPFDVGNGVQLTSTISIGCASYPFTANPHDLVSWQDVVNIADKALYCAKKSGRNSWVRLRTDHDASSLSKQALLTEIGSLVQQGLVIAETSVTGSLVWD